MRKFAPELDQLMWFLAENGSTQAVEEFEGRYPDAKYELARRIALVRRLKSEGKKLHRSTGMPRFHPVEVRRAVPSRRLVFGVAGLSLAALAAATFSLVTFLQPPAPTPVPPAPRVVESPEPSAALRAKPYVAPPVDSADPGVARHLPEQPPAEPKPRYLAPQDLKIDGAPLLSALQLIATQGGIDLTVAPGMPNPEVDFEFERKNTIEMLQDLGRKYAFTAFDQGDGSVLIIPAVDPQTAQKDPAPPTPLEKDPAKGTRRADLAQEP
ncbi:MAG TPA: hypothetical protein VGE01_06665 [Fimbriimonas sp.]